MKKIKISDDDFIKLWQKLGSPILVAKELSMPPRSVMNKRVAIECKYNIKLETHNSQRQEKKRKTKKNRSCSA